MEEIIDFDDNSMLAHTPEGKLMTCILTQAIEDALYRQAPNRVGTKNMKYHHKVNFENKIDAIKWLFTNSELLDSCCFIVNVHKDSIRKKMIDIIGADIIHPLVYNVYKP
jgi:hypothetical protein